MGFLHNEVDESRVFFSNAHTCVGESGFNEFNVFLDRYTERLMHQIFCCCRFHGHEALIHAVIEL